MFEDTPTPCLENFDEGGKKRSSLDVGCVDPTWGKEEGLEWGIWREQGMGGGMMLREETSFHPLLIHSREAIIADNTDASAFSDEESIIGVIWREKKAGSFLF